MTISVLETTAFPKAAQAPITGGHCPMPEVKEIPLQQAQIDGLYRCLEDVVNAGLKLDQIDRTTFPLAELKSDLEEWRRDLCDVHSSGFLLFTGFPLGSGPLEAAMMFAGLSSHFGTLMPQSQLGDLIGEVRDVGGLSYRERAYRNRLPLGLHTDRCDYLGMLCLQEAASGGLCTFADGLKVRSEIERTQYELLEELERGFALHRFGQIVDGDSPVTPYKVPVFSSAEGVVSVSYIRAYIKLVEDEGFCELTSKQHDALDLLDMVANKNEVRLEHRLLPGEAFIINNTRHLHGRTAFEDSSSVQRHMLRTWISDPSRPMVEVLRQHKSHWMTGSSSSTVYQGPGYQHTTDLSRWY